MAISAKDVNPSKWKEKIVLMDNGHYSAVIGYYDGSPERSIGVRWNGESGGGDGNLKGYPTTFGNPQFHVEPKIFYKGIIHACIEENFKMKNAGTLSDYEHEARLRACLEALKDWFRSV